MRRTILATCLVVGLTGCTPPKAQPVAKPTPSPSSPTQGRETQPQPVDTRFHDCGDGDAPCVTFDEGEMRLVGSYQPYAYTTLNRCDVEDYPTNMPCVLKNQDRSAQWIVLTAA